MCVLSIFYISKSNKKYICLFISLILFKLDGEKAEEPEINLPTSAGSSKKQLSSKKTCISALLTMLKPLTMWITTNCGKFLKRWEYQTI